jgi:uncharacterized protein YoxC
MLMRILGFCLLAVVLTSVASAQDAEPPAPTEELTLASLKKEVDSLRAQLDGVTNNLTETVTQLSDLKQQQKVLTDRINEELEKQQQILEAISNLDSAGQRIPRISAIMDTSEEFREDVRRAVHKSLETRGDFSVTNKTASYQRIWINQQEYGVSAGETLTLKPPVGTVTTQLPGKGLKNWTLTAPDYKESIDIVPASAPSTIVGRPIYVSPPAPITYGYMPPIVDYYVLPW